METFKRFLAANICVILIIMFVGGCSIVVPDLLLTEDAAYYEESELSRLNETVKSDNKTSSDVSAYSELQKYSNIYQEDLEKVRSVLARIVNDSMSEQQKIKAVHDFLVKNTKYDIKYYSRQNSHDQLHNILFNKIGVCQGYSVAFYVFMNELNIPCTLMLGNAYDEDGCLIGHAWNAVKLSGEWYFVDVTWDDPIINGSNDYQDGSNISYKYALCKYEDISGTHIYDEYIGQLPTLYGRSNAYKEWMYISSGFNGVYRITGLEDVKQVGASVNGSCKYVFIIEGGGITDNDVSNAFFKKINGRLDGTMKYRTTDNEIIITFIQK